MKVAAFFLCVFTLASTACVDGKTPDCTTVDSGCFPEDTGSPPIDSGSDASVDATNAGDASSVPDAPTG